LSFTLPLLLLLLLLVLVLLQFLLLLLLLLLVVVPHFFWLSGISAFGVLYFVFGTCVLLPFADFVVF